VTADLVEPRRGAWRSRLPWILLAVSLALNLCFVGGLFWVRMEASHVQMGPAERIELVAKQLALDADQRAAFDRFAATVRQKSRHLRETNQPVIDDAWQEFAKERPDEAAIDKLFEQAANNRRSFQIETGRALREFLVSLSEDQRTKFIGLVKKREGRNTPPLLRQLVQ
jgi:uncharacterized membrane protein